MGDEERERQAWADRRKKIEQMKAQERADRKRREKEANGDDDDDDEDEEEDEPEPEPKKKKKYKDDDNKPSNKKKPKKKKNDTDDDDEENDDIGEVEKLRPLLADLFDTRSEKDVFEIKTRKKGNGFKIDFGIIIATSMHPADYIDTFD